MQRKDLGQWPCSKSCLMMSVESCLDTIRTMQAAGDTLEQGDRHSLNWLKREKQGRREGGREGRKGGEGRREKFCPWFEGIETIIHRGTAWKHHETLPLTTDRKQRQTNAVLSSLTRFIFFHQSRM